MINRRESEPIAFESQAAWRTWLDERHAAASEVWIKIAKAGSGIASVTHAEALDVALCYGWIDGLRRGLDGDYFLQRFTPRRQRSKWSQVNRRRVTELIEAGQMQPAGLREVERARADGRWDAAYPAQSQMTVPDDLRAALVANDAARAFFETLDSRNRYAVLFRIHDAKKPETRASRIAKFVEMLSEGKKVYP